MLPTFGKHLLREPVAGLVTGAVPAPLDEDVPVQGRRHGHQQSDYQLERKLEAGEKLERKPPFTGSRGPTGGHGGVTLKGRGSGGGGPLAGAVPGCSAQVWLCNEEPLSLPCQETAWSDLFSGRTLAAAPRRLTH